MQWTIAAMRSQQAHAARDEWKRQLKDAERQINDLLDRLAETQNRPVAQRLEERIEKLGADLLPESGVWNSPNDLSLCGVGGIHWPIW